MNLLCMILIISFIQFILLIVPIYVPGNPTYDSASTVYRAIFIKIIIRISYYFWVRSFRKSEQ